MKQPAILINPAAILVPAPKTRSYEQQVDDLCDRMDDLREEHEELVFELRYTLKTANRERLQRRIQKNLGRKAIVEAELAALGERAGAF